MPFRFNPFTKKLDLVSINQVTPSTLTSLTGDSGGAVGPDGSGTINVVGGTGISVVGTPLNNTLTVSATGGASVFVNRTVVITPAELRSLSSSTVTLIPAPGAGFIVTPFFATTVFQYGGTIPYADGASIQIAWAGPGGTPAGGTGIATLCDQSIIIDTQDDAQPCVTVNSGSPIDLASIENRAVIFGTTTDFTGGTNDDNVLTVNIQYMIVTI